MTAQPRGITDLGALEAVFGALAHQSRRTILLVLLAPGAPEGAGLVHAELRGRQRVYRLDRDRLRSVAGGWLARFE